MKIAFYPYQSTENKYASIIINILKSIRGTEVYPFVPVAYLKFSKKIWGADLIWLNWFELDHGKIKTLMKIWTLVLLKLTGKSIVYTLHNKKLHNKKMSTVSSLLQNSLYYFADTIIIHSNASKEILPEKYRKKTQYIPHPNYINEYGPILKQELSKSKKLRLLFIGQVKPYKNIELLLNALSEVDHEVVELTIAGKPTSNEYSEQLLKLAIGKDIKFIFEFVKDEEINQYLANCDMLVLPYDMASSLNSGSVILAFSYAKTIICPSIGTVEDMESKAFLTYTYHDNAEHQKVLKSQLEQAIKLKKEDVNVFDNWGKVMYEDVLKNNSREKVKVMIENNVLRHKFNIS